MFSKIMLSMIPFAKLAIDGTKMGQRYSTDREKDTLPATELHLQGSCSTAVELGWYRKYGITLAALTQSKFKPPRC